MDELLQHFPQLDDTAAAAIAMEFERWWMSFPAEELADADRTATLIGFAGGWLARPTSDF